MIRLTIHLNRVTPKKESRTKKGVVEEKYITYNTITYNVTGEEEARGIVNRINEETPRNNVKKWYLSNIK